MCVSDDTDAFNKYYEQIEQQHTFITRMLYNIQVITCAAVFTLLAMQPISYIIFDYPKPDQWRIPIYIQLNPVHIL